MTGVTGSRNFPTTPGAAQRTLRLSGSGVPYRNVDGFVAKLFADGSRLLYSTYLGGSDADYASSIAVDESGAVYVAGTTESADLAGRAYTISPRPGASLLLGHLRCFSQRGWFRSDRPHGTGRELLRSRLGSSTRHSAQRVARWKHLFP
jgi:Beta-propeller repeat